MMTRSFRPLSPAMWASLFSAGAVLVGAVWFFNRTPAAAPPPAPALAAAPGTFRPTKGQLDGLKIAPVQSMVFRSEELTDGSIANNDDATTPVFSPYSGQVAKLFVKLGDVVKKGDPLMAVEASEFVQGQTDLVSAAAGLSTARAQVTLITLAEQRQHELLLAKSGAQKDWLQSQADLSAAQNTLRSADAALIAARSRLRILGKSAREISQIEAEPNLQGMGAQALVRAPIAGTVIGRQVGPGQYLQSASAGAVNPVFSIGNLSTVWMVGNVRETDAPKMHIGLPVEVQVLAWPKRTFNATISWISPSVDPITHRLPVRAQIDNRDGALKPMMYASFRILTGEAASAPGIAQSAVVYEGAEAHVFVAKNDGTLAVRMVRLGRVSGDMVEVLDGLTAGDNIVTRGALFIDRATESN